MASQLDGHEFEQALELLMDREALCAIVHGVAQRLGWQHREWPWEGCGGAREHGSLHS